nr:immunoglobulin heavy chain junction region [Macaca mulatta]MOY23193.1 immunoglobulin heavy chain junction region [Macaca mulatta]MOY23459.1 immunoglobulin heavy chain junction region [Macaca mulatta]MOY23613.1 immunoglobulin heavy chain junction region [Macaca mulatta]MOY23794.1 immunoglobulin heavy chain junction region [Macaca mulatta]
CASGSFYDSGYYTVGGGLDSW